MSTDTHWRSSVAYRHTNRLSSSGAAWELLRRNPGYRQDWASTDSATHTTHGSRPPVPEKARHWGLHFLGGSRQDRLRHRHLLAA